MSDVTAALAGVSGKVFIDGALSGALASSSLDVIDPATEQRIGEIMRTPAAQIDEAIAVSRSAQRKWAAMGGA